MKRTISSMNVKDNLIKEYGALVSPDKLLPQGLPVWNIQNYDKKNEALAKLFDKSVAIAAIIRSYEDRFLSAHLSMAHARTEEELIVGVGRALCALRSISCNLAGTDTSGEGSDVHSALLLLYGKEAYLTKDYYQAELKRLNIEL